MCAVRILPHSPITERHTFSMLADPVHIQGKTIFSVFSGVKTRSSVKKNSILNPFPA